MLTCVPTRVLASTSGHPANATPWLESAPHNLDVRHSLPVHAADPPLNGLAGLPAILFRAPSDALAQHEHLSIPILLPR